MTHNANSVQISYRHMFVCLCVVQMDKAAALLGMSTSYIVPVKNYSSELDLDVNTDVLLLSAVDHILQYADLYFQDNPSQNLSKMSL